MEKIRILFFNEKQNNGVSYYRTVLPAIKLQEMYPNEFHVDIVNQFDFNNIDEVKKYHIIHAHTRFVDFEYMESMSQGLKKMGIKIIIDIDDYWNVPKTHPAYTHVKQGAIDKAIENSLKQADYVTCTTSYFADTIRKINPNVEVLPNGVDLDSLNFKDRKTSSDRVRIGYLAGSSHQKDIEQLKGFVNSLTSDNEIKDKFILSLNGFDVEGFVDIFKPREDFLNDLRQMGLYTKEVINDLNKNIHDLKKVRKIPKDLFEKYQWNIITMDRQKIDPLKTSWYQYERIFTDDYKIIKSKEYKNDLLRFERNIALPNKDEQYIRNWTLPVNQYATMYNDIDISLAPLEDNLFNNCKSELKLIEAFSRKIAVIASDVIPYNTYGVSGKNCILVPNEGRDKKWVKAIKKLLKEPNLREDLGNQLYEDFKPIFDIKVTTEKRRDFYKKIVS